MFWMQSALFSNFSILLAYFNYNLCLKNTHTHICWQNFNLNYFHLKQTLSKQAFIDFDLSLKLLIAKANVIYINIKRIVSLIYCILIILYLPSWPIKKWLLIIGSFYFGMTKMAWKLWYFISIWMVWNSFINANYNYKYTRDMHQDDHFIS